MLFLLSDTPAFHLGPSARGSGVRERTSRQDALCPASRLRLEGPLFSHGSTHSSSTGPTLPTGRPAGPRLRPATTGAPHTPSLQTVSPLLLFLLLPGCLLSSPPPTPAQDHPQHSEVTVPLTTCSLGLRWVCFTFLVLGRGVNVRKTSDNLTRHLNS